MKLNEEKTINEKGLTEKKIQRPLREGSRSPKCYEE
jgi:hypothetical protein